MKKYTLLLLLLIGLILRIAISFSNYSGDVTTLMIWGEDAVKHGLPGLYGRNFEKIYGHVSPNYPPITILFFAFLYLVKGWIYNFAWFLNLHIPFFPSNLIFFLQDFNYFPYLIKLPAIFSDIGIAFISYLFMNKIIRSEKSKWPIIAASFVLFNPAYIYNSAYWGQTDSIPLFFVLWAFYLLFFSNKLILSAVIFTLGLLTKQTAVIFTPIYLLFFSTKSKIGQLFKSLSAAIIIFIIFFIPFFHSGNILAFAFSTYLNKILLSPGIPYTSNHAFNFWFLLTGSRHILASSKFILNISYELWGLLITAFFSALILIKAARSHFQLKHLLYPGFLIPLICFLFLTKMHERHLILTLPFLLLVSYENRFTLFAFIFISFFNFINMYHDWWSPKINLLIFILTSRLIIYLLTIILIGLLFYFFKNYFFPGKKQKKNI